MLVARVRWASRWKDAGSLASGASGATEDAAARRPARPCDTATVPPNPLICDSQRDGFRPGREPQAQNGCQRSRCERQGCHARPAGDDAAQEGEGAAATKLAHRSEKPTRRPRSAGAVSETSSVVAATYEMFQPMPRPSRTGCQEARARRDRRRRSSGLRRAGRTRAAPRSLRRPPRKARRTSRAHDAPAGTSRLPRLERAGRSRPLRRRARDRDRRGRPTRPRNRRQSCRTRRRRARSRPESPACGRCDP